MERRIGLLMQQYFSFNQWTVQCQQNHGFLSVACDMTIEQTLNRDSKTKGGKNKLTYSLPVVTAPLLKVHIPNISIFQE